MELHICDPLLAEPQSERTPLLHVLEERGDDRMFEVLPLKYGEVLKAADTTHRAFVNDAIMTYYRSVDTAPLYDTRWKLRHIATFSDAVHQGRMLTVNQGEALLEYGVPGNSDSSKLLNIFLTVLESTDTPELKRRKTEFRGMIQGFIKDVFGPRVNDMYSLEVLATAPEAQGQGYASALVVAVTDKALAEGRDTWVITAGARSFYERLGFRVIWEGTLGTNDPTWEGEPISIFVLLKSAGKASPTVENSPASWEKY